MKEILPPEYKPLPKLLRQARKSGKNHLYTDYPKEAGAWGWLFNVNFDVIEGKCKYWWIK
jgi:hypothetical protein